MCVHTTGCPASSLVARNRLPLLARRPPLRVGSPPIGEQSYINAATAPPLCSSCAAATSGGRGVWGAGGRRRRPGGAEDPARCGAGARLSPPTAGRGAGSAARGPRASGSATAPPRAPAPRRASRAPWAPARPAAASSFPSPAAPAAVAGRGAAPSAQVPSAGGSGAGDRRRRGRCCCSCPRGPAGRPPARRRGPWPPKPWLPLRRIRDLSSPPGGPAPPPQVAAAPDLAPWYAHLRRRGLLAAERVCSVPAPSSSGPRPRAGVPARTFPLAPSRGLCSHPSNLPVAWRPGPPDFPPAPSRGLCASPGAPSQTPYPFAPGPHLTPHNPSPSSLGLCPLT